MKREKLQSRLMRRMTVAGFYTGAPIWFWLTDSYVHGDAPPAGWEWFTFNVLPWLALGFFVFFILCLTGLLRSSVGGVFAEPRDERQQAAFTRAYSLSYRIFSGLIVIPGLFFSVTSMFVADWFSLTANRVGFISSILVVIACTLPRAVAMWLEPDPIPEDEALTGQSVTFVKS